MLYVELRKLSEAILAGITIPPEAEHHPVTLAVPIEWMRDLAKNLAEASTVAEMMEAARLTSAEYIASLEALTVPQKARLTRDRDNIVLLSPRRKGATAARRSPGGDAA